ncbi:hypothetical protein FB451DRAFT_1561704 [Mycena latifolia]|nr:hypothetical protein FB451DRAFT_1561704 [Mycena latifolia]
MAENDSRQKTEALWFSPEIAQSSVFADMFAFPQPPSESAETETMNGFPVIKLHDDPDDVEVFLKAIFDSSFFTPPEDTPLEAIAGILRLSHKCDVPYLRRRALKHLETTYPTSLSEYDSCCSAPRDKPAQWLKKIIAPIQIAAEVGALWLLPAALGEQERSACLIGDSTQTQYFPKILGFLLVSKYDSADCNDYIECNRLRLEVASIVDHWRDMTWTLDAWEEGDWEDMAERGICETCMNEAKALYAAARQGFWDQLPQMFSLPGWEELEEMRRVALSTS